MKIAVACDGNIVAGHFGHCEMFNVYEVLNREVIKSEAIANPGHKPGFLPNFLNDLGINVIISGGMGAGAIDIFNEKGIEVITGASGNADQVVNDYLQGVLKSAGAVCQAHQHHGTCGH